MDIFGSTDPREMPAHLFHGACELDYDTAIPASIEAQHYTVCPRYWYVDAWIQCADCDNLPLFSKEEQRHWYETLKFWIGSFPDRCKSCQKASKEMHQQLDYIRIHCRDAKKAEKVQAMLKEVVDRYGFLPRPLQTLPGDQSVGG